MADGRQRRACRVETHVQLECRRRFDDEEWDTGGGHGARIRAALDDHAIERGGQRAIGRIGDRGGAARLLRIEGRDGRLLARLGGGEARVRAGARCHGLIEFLRGGGSGVREPLDARGGRRGECQRGLRARHVGRRGGHAFGGGRQRRIGTRDIRAQRRGVELDKGLSAADAIAGAHVHRSDRRDEPAGDQGGGACAQHATGVEVRGPIGFGRPGRHDGDGGPRLGRVLNRRAAARKADEKWQGNERSTTSHRDPRMGKRHDGRPHERGTNGARPTARSSAAHAVSEARSVLTRRASAASAAAVAASTSRTEASPAA